MGAELLLYNCRWATPSDRSSRLQGNGVVETEPTAKSCALQWRFYMSKLRLLDVHFTRDITLTASLFIKSTGATWTRRAPHAPRAPLVRHTNIAGQLKAIHARKLHFFELHFQILPFSRQSEPSTVLLTVHKSPSRCFSSPSAISLERILRQTEMRFKLYFPRLLFIAVGLRLDNSVVRVASVIICRILQSRRNKNCRKVSCYRIPNCISCEQLGRRTNGTGDVIGQKFHACCDLHLRKFFAKSECVSACK